MTAPNTDLVRIDKPGQSAIQGLTAEQEKLYDTLTGMLVAEPDWKQRRNTLFAIIQKFRTAFDGTPKGSRPRSLEQDLKAGEMPFMSVLPIHIAVLLEKLDETCVKTVEQAAFYLLSVHPEHQAAADRWLQNDKKHLKAFMKFLDTNPYYRALYEEWERYGADPDA
jgi:hypothetical protein